MKCRLGFVSNSSSSSFLIYGIEMDAYVIGKKLGISEELIDEDGNDVIWEKLEEALPDGFSIDCPFDDGFYIGRSWDKVGDDETGKQFKDNVEMELKKLFGDEFGFGTQEMAWRDG